MICSLKDSVLLNVKTLTVTTNMNSLYIHTLRLIMDTFTDHEIEHLIGELEDELFARKNSKEAAEKKFEPLFKDTYSGSNLPDGYIE